MERNPDGLVMPDVKQLPGLEGDLASLDKLHEWLLEARSLRDRGLAGLSRFLLESMKRTQEPSRAAGPGSGGPDTRPSERPDAKVTRAWDDESSPISATLMRRAKHLAWHLGHARAGGEADWRGWEDANAWPRIKPFNRPLHLGKEEDYRRPDRDAERELWGEHADETRYLDVDPYKVREGSSVLLAATYLRTRLDDLPTRVDAQDAAPPAMPSSAAERAPHLDRHVLRCFYRLLRELYFAESPDWSVGGAQVGGRSGIVSVFVTSECARALGHLAKMLDDTANHLDEAASAARYLGRIDILDERNADGSSSGPLAGLLDATWCDAERDRVLMGLRVMDAHRSHSVLIHQDPDWAALAVAGTGGSGPLDLHAHGARQFLRDLTDAALGFCAKTAHELSVLERELADDPLVAPGPDAVLGFRAWERLRRPFHDQDPSSRGSQAGIPNFDLSATPHALAYDAIQRAHRDLTTICGGWAAIEERDADAERLEGVARWCRTAGKWVRRLLQPVKLYMDARMHEIIFQVETNGVSSSLQDLAFAAASSRLLSTAGDGDPVHRKAWSILARNIDQHGRLPQGPAFDVGHGGRQRHAVNAQALRAFAQLSQHLDDVPHEQFTVAVTRMLTYFRANKVEVPGGLGWRRVMSGERQTASPWVTTVAAITLHRIVRLLEEKINDRIARHFTRIRPEQLRAPGIDGIMCADMGLALVPWQRGAQATVTTDLERMRAHLLGVRLPGLPEPISSVILYGPPGTGKTTLIDALARSAWRPLYLVTPGDLLKHGADAVEKQASAVMHALCMLTSAIVLFDEFDSMLYKRDRDASQAATGRSLFDFTTAGMLPRLADLNKAAKRNRVTYALATNYVDDLDAAAIRMGRFDNKRCVHYPDAVGRSCRIAHELLKWDGARQALVARGLAPPWRPPADVRDRLARVVAETGSVPISQLCKSGWYVAPSPEEVDGPLWTYLLGRRGAHDVPWPLPRPTASARLTAEKLWKSSVPELLIDQAAQRRVVDRFDDLLWSAGGAITWDTLRARLRIAAAGSGGPSTIHEDVEGIVAWHDAMYREYRDHVRDQAAKWSSEIGRGRPDGAGGEPPPTPPS